VVGTYRAILCTEQALARPHRACRVPPASRSRMSCISGFIQVLVSPSPAHQHIFQMPPTDRNERSTRSRSRSPYHAPRHHRTRTRSRSPHESREHRKRRRHDRSPATEVIALPYKAQRLSKRQYDEYKPLFHSYLDIQKGLNLDELDEREARGRWKSFVSRW
jgi:hypothetical protein